jgi:hypothetical protein
MTAEIDSVTHIFRGHSFSTPSFFPGSVDLRKRGGPSINEDCSAISRAVQRLGNDLDLIRTASRIPGTLEAEKSTLNNVSLLASHRSEQPVRRHPCSFSSLLRKPSWGSSDPSLCIRIHSPPCPSPTPIFVHVLPFHPPSEKQVPTSTSMGYKLYVPGKSTMGKNTDYSSN